MADIRAGDVVLHRPTGEEWVVAAVQGDDLAWCGWPPGTARTSDCELVQACSDEAHVTMAQREWRGSDYRDSLARSHDCDVCRVAKEAR